MCLNEARNDRKFEQTNIPNIVYNAFVFIFMHNSCHSGSSIQ
jgi:hypothetical protein